ncbi:hypothetical protein [Arthrobacter sp. 18067]|uniref:hypothetical protein n=1 Tax=Arthrobacter sp. 18067 TaxID=2681413 RepID=UPI00135BCA7D|nr:hypothetical protein [Arthrobacter sp. 18067]
MTQKTELQTLQAFLEDDFMEFTNIKWGYAEGDDLPGGAPGEYRTIHVEHDEPRRWSRFGNVVTRVPSGALYQWQYDEALTEMGEHSFLGNLTEVREERETVVVTKYLEVGK